MKRQSHGSLSSKVFDLLSLKKLLELDAGPCADNPSKKARKEIYAIYENFDEKTLCEMQFLKEQVEHIWKSCKDIFDKHKKSEESILRMYDLDRSIFQDAPENEEENYDDEKYNELLDQEELVEEDDEANVNEVDVVEVNKDEVSA
ncbi:hypothetical protein QTN25_008993 [Entamoeba marina]